MAAANFLNLFSPLLSPDSGAEGGFSGSILILGYGNPDREDDGVAWHILDRLASRLDPDSQGMGEETVRSFGRVTLKFALQLMPEMAEEVAEFGRVVFIDAHTGSEPEDLTWLPLAAQFQKSPFTHHMTPATLLSIAESLYGSRPEAVLVAVRGFDFGFRRGLSERTLQLSQQAEQKIWEWI